MSNDRPIQSTKRCFVYCGDRCNCALAADSVGRGIWQFNAEKPQEKPITVIDEKKQKPKKDE